jgi:acetoin utilization protein AcuC
LITAPACVETALDGHVPLYAPARAAFIGSGAYRRPSYGRNHPLAIPRVSLTFDLLRAYGALADDEIVQARKAADFELEWFHTRDYVAAIRRAEALGRVAHEHRERHRIGTLENPFFDRLFSTPATAAGASIQAAEAVLEGRLAFNPAGGMHHARPDAAQGFCYFNDVVLAVIRLRRAGLRVAYVDIDAHHCDGVEAAFARDPQVLTVSLHMDTAYGYPGSGGGLGDCGSPDSGHTAVNVPLPRDVNDAEYRMLVEEVVPRAFARFRPDAVVLQAGTDMIAGDPLGKWRLATETFLHAAGVVIAVAPRHANGTAAMMATGGGGYHPILLARAWTGLWGLLSGRDLPEAMPAGGQSLLRAVGWESDDDEDDGDMAAEQAGRRAARLYTSRLDGPPASSVRPHLAALRERVLEHPLLRR